MVNAKISNKLYLQLLIRMEISYMNDLNRYPALEINLENIRENAKTIIEKCKERNVSISGVIKGFNGINKIAEEFINAGCMHIASSRLEQLINLSIHQSNIETMLLRAPMKSEIPALIENVNISLNSEWETIMLLEKECAKQKVSHGVVLMLDVGDLREGFFNAKELFDLALHIENKLKHVKLKGIGTNLGCFGSIKPSTENLMKLNNLAEEINSSINRKLEIVSGGQTTSLPLLLKGEMPPLINNLRIGEAILLNRDMPDLWKFNIPGMNKDTFLLKAQIIEIKNKPSYPIGEQFIDGFGSKPNFIDKGIRKRALLAIGKQDFGSHKNLIPMASGVEIVGSSSDHLIVDLEMADKDYKLGDILDFGMYYGSLLYLCSSEWVSKAYI